MRGRKSSIKLEYFWDFWIKVIEESESGTVIIVEGKKDEIVLRALLIRGRILLLQNGSISSITENMKVHGEKRAIIFTDFDRKGEFLARRIKSAFIREGISVLDNYRVKFKWLVNGLSHIEDLRGFLDEIIESAPFNIYIKIKAQDLGIGNVLF